METVRGEWQEGDVFGRKLGVFVPSPIRVSYLRGKLADVVLQVILEIAFNTLVSLQFSIKCTQILPQPRFRDGMV